MKLELPSSARGISCRFRFWQPTHSGYGQDVWAIDDLTLTSHPTNILNIVFNSTEGYQKNLGLSSSYCGKRDVLRFNQKLPSRPGLPYIETSPVQVGPGSIIQIELAIACEDATKHGKVFNTNFTPVTIKSI